MTSGGGGSSFLVFVQVIRTTPGSRSYHHQERNKTGRSAGGALMQFAIKIFFLSFITRSQKSFPLRLTKREKRKKKVS